MSRRRTSIAPTTAAGCVGPMLLGLLTAGGRPVAAEPVASPYPLQAQTTRAAASPRAAPLSQARAIRIATAFCKAIGAPVTAPATATHGVTEPGSLLPSTYWQPVWRVRFGSDAEVEIADSGVICRYLNSALSQQLSQDHRTPGSAISRADALTRSAAVLAAAHVPERLAPPQSQQENYASPAQRATHVWFVIRRRQAQGVPFQDQQATVQLQAETGAVMGLGVTFPTPPPAPAKPRLTAAQAVTTAQAALARMKPGDNFRPVGQVRLTWVTPETQLIVPHLNGVAPRPPTPVPATDRPARLAWMCFLRDATGNGAFLPVDAVTGQIVPSGMGFSYAPIRRPPVAETPASPPPTSTPPPPSLGVTVTATTLPAANISAPPPGVPRYRLSLTDVYASLSALSALGLDGTGPGLGGNEKTDQSLAEQIQQAARAGAIVVVPGPSAVVPEGGAWGLVRTRAPLCTDPLYWKPRPAPGTIVMTFSVTPRRQADGRIMYRCEQGTKALAPGQAWSPNDFLDTQSSGGNSWGDAGATTLLSSLDEERYNWETGHPAQFRTVGIMHILLIRGESLPETP